MPQTLFENYSVFMADQFKKSFGTDNEPNLYLAFGKTAAWANDSSPNTVNTSVQSTIETWKNLIGAKRVTGGDIVLAIPRHNWASGVKYTQYDYQVPNIFEANTPFYVVNSDFNVYKCLYNANTVSTVEPTSLNPTNVIQTADGYIWKFMYTISDAEQIKYVTDSYIPVKTLSLNDGSLQWVSQTTADDGAIYAIELTSGGSGYLTSSNAIITIEGDGEGAVATANVNTASNTIQSILVTTYGSGYTRANVTITSNEGTGATARALIGPPGGHGTDPIYELGARNILFNIRLLGSEQGVFPTINDYRQVVLLLDPVVYGTSNVAANSLYSLTTDVTVSGFGANYENDEYVYQGASFAGASFTGLVVEADNANGVIRMSNVEGSPAALPLIGVNSAAAKFVDSIDYSEFVPNTGRILYINNIEPITRNASQTEDFKIVLRF